MLRYPKTIDFWVKHLKVLANCCLNWICVSKELPNFACYQNHKKNNICSCQFDLYSFPRKMTLRRIQSSFSWNHPIEETSFGLGANTVKCISWWPLVLCEVLGCRIPRWDLHNSSFQSNAQKQMARSDLARKFHDLNYFELDSINIPLIHHTFEVIIFL